MRVLVLLGEEAAVTPLLDDESVPQNQPAGVVVEVHRRQVVGTVVVGDRNEYVPPAQSPQLVGPGVARVTAAVKADVDPAQHWVHAAAVVREVEGESA